MATSIHVFTLDCLRESVCSDDITPFLHSLPLQWSRCYSSGTWTLPSHASLLSGRDPIDHRVTRSESSIENRDARLTKRASENGYETALFSENPRFSSIAGFDGCVDVAHDFIDWNLFPSEFTPVTAIDELSVSEAVWLSREILLRPNRVSNLANTVYTAYRRFSDPQSKYPHHGERVISHLESYLSERSEPTLTVTNLLDPHNPYYGSPPSRPMSHSVEEDQALRDRQSNLLYLFTDEPIPEPIRDVFGDWETCFAVERDLYKQFSQEADRLVRRWHDDQPSRFGDDLIVVLGDHGQLFGAEGEVGHSTSLHPNGIHVPLAVDPPAGWDDPELTISDPVSIAGLGHALIDVVTGAVTSTSEFVAAITDHSRGPADAVLSCVDGPTAQIPPLYKTDRFDNDLVTERCVRKVACIFEDYIDIYQCHYNDDTVSAASYRYTDDSREPLPERDTPPVPNDIEEWVTRVPNSYDAPSHAVEPDDERPEAITERLKNLGYQ